MIDDGATNLAVATDHVIESLRNALWSGYKTGGGIEPALLAQFRPLEEALTTMGVVVWPMIELEADDALASAARIAAADARTQKVCIWTPDKDLAQCVRGDRVVQVDRKTGKIRDAEGVREKFGVDPIFIPDLLALVGDAADGYPGLPGIGRTAAARPVRLPLMQDPTLTTLAEQSGFARTGRTDEVTRLCAAFTQAWPKVVHTLEFGRSAEGRPMRALIACRADPRQVPLLMLQGGIHPGESDGKDAGFIALRELLGETASPGVLERIAILFVPAFNVDGHERFGRWNRPHQNGPGGRGRRTPAPNLDLNRYYSKADAPEMQAMLRLVNAWDPLAYIDLHVTDGAQFEHDIAVLIEPVDAGDAELQRVGRSRRDTLFADLAAQGSSPLAVYPSFVVDDDPATGLRHGVPGPSWSHGYFHCRNRFGMLVEIHSWKDYPTRVRIT